MLNKATVQILFFFNLIFLCPVYLKLLRLFIAIFFNIDALKMSQANFDTGVPEKRHVYKGYG